MGRKIRRVISVLLLLCAILITQLPVPEMSAAGSDDFQMNQNTLVKYLGTASTVSISDDVKVIGEEAFADNLGLNVISCGTNTKKISHGAFANCTYLSKAEIPDSIEDIDSAAFSGCESLTKVSIGKNVKYIGDGVFAGCNSLKEISIDKNNKNLVMSDGALYNKDKTILYAYLNGNTTDTYKMPNTVEKIKEYAFWGNETLENITLSSALNEIPGYAFANCRNLKEITIPYSVKSIDAKSFENCISLKDTTIPSAISYINATAFDGCYKLNIIADEGSVASDYFAAMDKSDISSAENSDTKAVVVSSNKTTDNSLENSSTEAETVTEEETEKKNLKDASDDPSNVDYMPKRDPLAGLEDSSVIAKSIIVNGNAVLFLNRDTANVHQGMIVRSDDKDNENGTIIYDPQKGGYLPKYTIVNDKVATQAFYADSDMKDYTIPNGVTSLGDFSYARSSLTDAKIPDGVTDIGYGAFYHCNQLATVKIPQSIENIQAYAFDHTPFITNWKSNQDGNDFLIVGNHILLAYKGINTNIEIPEGVQKISPGCFQNHSELQSVYLPDSVKEIGEDAFRDCSGLTTISGGNYLESIGDRAFYKCPITTYTIPSTVKSIGLRAIDFTDTQKDDSTKAVVFNGNVLPNISYGKTSQRLMNEDYRKNALHNVLFAVVNDSCENFEDTVLDGNKLGFSGLVLTIEKDSSGNETGNVNVRKNNVFSDTVLKKIPEEVSIKGKKYQIKDFDKIELASAKDTDSDNNVKVLYNSEESSEITAEFSENEDVGYLSITDSKSAGEKIKRAYQELFGDTIPAMVTYDIELMDVTKTVPITKFGQAVLSISMPIPKEIKGDTYHVICMDDDNQLEEVNTNINKEDNTITFEVSHLSEYAIYSTGAETVTLNVKDGKLINNLKKDDSPDTGDYSLPVQYVLATFILSLSLLLFFWKSKSKKV